MKSRKSQASVVERQVDGLSPRDPRSKSIWRGPLPTLSGQELAALRLTPEQCYARHMRPAGTPDQGGFLDKEEQASLDRKDPIVGIRRVINGFR